MMNAIKYFSLLVFILTHSLILAQISDDFSDGDFTANPAWGGTTTDFTVNGSFELQLNNTVAATSYLSTPHGLASLDNKEWTLWTRQAFSPSGSNFGRIYLTSTSADLTTDPDGFYLQLGEAGSNDAVRLFKCDGGVHTEILTGPLGQIASSFSIGIRVVRDNLANWDVYVDAAGGTNYTLIGSVTDATALMGTHFGMLDTYTVSNSTDFYYDNIYVGDEILDLTAPVLMSVTPINGTQVDVLFDEPLDQTSAELVSNYSITPGITINTAVLDGVNPNLVHLNLGTSLTNGQSYDLTSNNVADVALNVSGSQMMNFTYLIAETPVPGDVVLNEFMCDPSPAVGLSEAEFVEIYNKSNKIFNLENWTLGDASGNGTVQLGWMMPGDHIVLTSSGDVGAFSNAVAVTSFPSLNNAGDDIVLRDDLGVLLDSITYTDAWYQDPAKADGGYSIELINPDAVCSLASNWRASDHAWGGTPGAVNSVYDSTPDVTAPNIVSIVVTSSTTIDVFFSEEVDSVSLANSIITVQSGLSVLSTTITGAYTSMVSIEFAETIGTTGTYTIELQNIYDCATNAADLSGSFSLASQGDIVINEILFNPLTGGGDWVELYNNSDKQIDLYGWQFANFDNDTIDNHESIEEHFVLGPGEYVVVAEDTLHIVQNYPNYIGGRFIQIDNLPTYSNSEGNVYIIGDNTQVDWVAYSEDWHFTLIDDVKGKSLERIDFDASSNDPHNWHTAAEAVGFATPGGENSQYTPAETNGDFSFTSETISPDNDGHEDVLQVNYEMTEPGLIADFTIYDDRGRKIASVLQAELLSASGMFTWDGVRDDNTKATIGTYVAVFEAFSIEGDVKFAKRKAFVVAGNL